MPSKFVYERNVFILWNNSTNFCEIMVKDFPKTESRYESTLR